MFIRHCQVFIDIFFRETRNKLIMSEKNFIQDRIASIISYYKLNKLSFSRKIKASDASIGNIVSGKRYYPRYEVLEKIAENFPDVSMEWLIRNHGHMLKDHKEEVMMEDSPAFLKMKIELLEMQIKEKDRTIELLEKMQKGSEVRTNAKKTSTQKSDKS